MNDRNIWLVAAGDGQHHYAYACLCNGVVIMGPGRQGPWPDCKPLLLQTGWTPKMMAILRTFCETMQAGDLVVLHVGASVYGVGEVAGPYIWDRRFERVQGWDLQHTRPVRWLWLAYENPRVFPPRALGRGDTVRPLRAEVVHDWLSTLDLKAEDMLNG